jgi:hypothetical protein
MLRTPFFGSSLVALSCIWLAGCAGPFGGLGAFSQSDSAPTFRDASMSMQDAKDAVVIGSATKADVLAALGSGNVVKFDSGFEVWVYKGRTANTTADRAEFVILFTPSGIVKKTRIRPAYETTL